MKKRNPKNCKKHILAIRVTQEELDAFDQRYVNGGLTRSEVIRSKLQISDVRKRRGDMSVSDAYDYHRAILIKTSINLIGLCVESLSGIMEEGGLNEALPVISGLVQREIKKVDSELRALQLKSGITNMNPALHHSKLELEYEFEAT